MAANPLLPSEVRALADQLRYPLTAWQADVIYRLDDAVISTWAGEMPKPKGKGADGDAAIPVDRPGDIGVMLRGLAATKAAKAEKAR